MLLPTDPENSQQYKRHEDVCTERILEVEHAVFTPLVFSTSGMQDIL
jgi:hypothetical protein